MKGAFIMGNLSLVTETAKGIQTVPVKDLLFSRRSIFISEINSETALNFAKEFMCLSNKKEPVNIYINSHGGEVNSGLLIYDLIQGSTLEINTYCMGEAYSMGAVLLAAGQKGRRFILPHSRVMIHEPLISNGVGGSATSISRISDSILETRRLLNEILAKHTARSAEEISKATSFDNFMNAEEAVEFGICDQIIKSIF